MTLLDRCNFVWTSSAFGRVQCDLQAMRMPGHGPRHVHHGPKGRESWVAVGYEGMSGLKGEWL